MTDMNMHQPSLFPECLEDMPDTASEFILKWPPLPAQEPVSWLHADPYLRECVLYCLHKKQPLDQISKASGLPLSRWLSDDPEFKREHDRADACGTLELGISLILSAMRGENKTLQVQMFKVMRELSDS